MLALDVGRIEAGLLLIDVDFHGSKKVPIDAQRYSPYEMKLGRLVAEKKGPFVGSEALSDQRVGSAQDARLSRPTARAAESGRASAGRSTGRTSNASSPTSACRRRFRPPPRA